MTLIGKFLVPVALATGLYGTADAPMQPPPVERMVTVPLSQVQKLLDDNEKMRDLLQRATSTLQWCSSTIEKLSDKLEKKQREVCA